MHTLLEEFQAEIDANAEVSFTISEIESMLSTDTDPDQPDQPADEGTSQQYTDTVLTDDAVATMEGWLDEEYFHNISDEVVLVQLDEILLLLIAIRDGGCGKELLHDVRRLFGTDLSPGTVYPHLNDLAEEGTLRVSERSKRKVYRLADREAVLNTVESTVNQLFTTSLVLKALTVDCKACHSQSHGREIDER